MRNRKDIKDESNSNDYNLSINQRLVLEVLLDIRELLINDNKMNG